MEELQKLLAEYAPNVWFQAAIIAFTGVLVAKIAQQVLLGIIGRLTSHTQTVVDDRIIALLHRPVFTTFAVFGLMAATARLSEALGEPALPVTLAFLKSIIIVVWVIFLIRAAGLILNGMARQPNRYNFAQRDTVPLMRNLAVVFLLLAGTYSIMLTGVFVSALLSIVPRLYVFFRRRGRKPLLRTERVAQWRWRQQEITGLAELRALRSENLKQTVLRLSLRMAVTLDELAEVEALLAELKGTDAHHGRVGVLQVDRTGLTLDTREVEELFSDLPDVLQAAASKLRRQTALPEKREVAERALQHLYHLVRAGG